MITRSFVFGLSLWYSAFIFAQEGGEQVNYEFTNIEVNDPDLIIGAGIGMYIPGVLGYEIIAMANEIAAPGIWGDFRYINSTGLSDGETFLAPMQEFKLRAGFANTSIAGQDSAIVLKSTSYVQGDKRYTNTVSLPVQVPQRRSTIFFGSVSQRKATLKVKQANGKNKGVVKNSSMVGGGIRWQRYENFSANVGKYGHFTERGLSAADLEVLVGDAGAYKGIHWLFSAEKFTLPWYFRVSVGSGISGLEKNVEILDTLFAQVSFGYTFSDSITKTSVNFEPSCWQSKRQVTECQR